jgi:hypothetical protein
MHNFINNPPTPLINSATKSSTNLPIVEVKPTVSTTNKSFGSG